MPASSGAVGKLGSSWLLRVRSCQREVMSAVVGYYKADCLHVNVYLSVSPWDVANLGGQLWVDLHYCKSPASNHITSLALTPNVLQMTLVTGHVGWANGDPSVSVLTVIF